MIIDLPQNVDPDDQTQLRTIITTTKTTICRLHHMCILHLHLLRKLETGIAAAAPVVDVGDALEVEALKIIVDQDDVAGSDRLRLGEVGPVTETTASIIIHAPGHSLPILLILRETKMTGRRTSKPKMVPIILTAIKRRRMP
jgi:hypothetical protein